MRDVASQLPARRYPTDRKLRANVIAVKRYGVFLDFLFLLLFVGIGRRTHHDGGAFAGFANTLWPFVTGLLAGWAFTRWTHRNSLSPTSGLLIVLATVAIGMALRVVSGQGIAFSFIIVATVFLSIFLVGWRFALSFVSRRRL